MFSFSSGDFFDGRPLKITSKIFWAPVKSISRQKRPKMRTPKTATWISPLPDPSLLRVSQNLFVRHFFMAACSLYFQHAYQKCLTKKHCREHNIAAKWYYGRKVHSRHRRKPKSLDVARWTSLGF